MSDGFDMQKFVQSFPVLARAEGGVTKLRQMVLSLGLRGDLTRATSHGRPATADAGLPTGWHRVAVGDVADCVLGKMLDGSKHTKGTKRPYLRNINVRWGKCDLADLLEMFFEDDELARYGTLPGDVLICEGGEPGRAAVWRSKDSMLIQKAIHRVRPSAKLLPDWLVMNLRRDTWSGRLAQYVTGATIKHFTGKALASYSIPLPPLDEQRRIVAKVDDLMALIDDLEAKQTKQREVQTRFRSSALDALTKAEGPEEQGAAWSRVADNFEVSFERAESVAEFRRLLRGLAYDGRITGCVARESDTVEGLSTSIVDCPHTTPKWTECGVLCLRTTNFKVGGLALAEVRYVSEETYRERIVRLVPQPGDVVYSREGGILGIACVIPGTCGKVCLGQRMMLIRPDPTRVKSEYMALVLNAPQTRQVVERLTGGTASPHLNVGDVRKFEVPLPPLAEQTRIVAKVDALMKLCDDLEAKLKAREATAAKLVDAVVRELVA